MKTFRLLLPFAVVIQLTSGCASLTKIKREYLYQPTLVELANPGLKEVKPTADLKVPTDADVLVFENNIKNVFRGRLNTAMIARHTSATAQVLTAAAAAALTTLSSGSKSAITILAASSALMPQLQQIFDAKGRAAAFEQGAEMLSDAESAYFKALSRTPRKYEQPNAALTPEGANLYVAVLAAIQVVEKLSVAQLPSVDQIRAAKGELIADLKNATTASADTSTPLEVPMKDTATPSFVRLDVEGVTEDGISYSSAGDVVAVKPETDAVILCAQKPGRAIVTAVVKNGGAKRVFMVHVFVPLSLKHTVVAAKVDDEITVEAVAQKISKITVDIPDVVASKTAAADLESTPQSSVTVKCGPNTGSAILHVIGEFGGEGDVTVHVSAKSP